MSQAVRGVDAPGSQVVRVDIRPDVVAIAVPEESSWPNAQTPRYHSIRVYLRRINQRVFDITFAVLMLVFLLPLFCLAAILVRLSSPGPIIYRQVRCGQGGKYFVLFKFRTMVDDADSLLRSNRRLNVAFHRQWKLENDPRVTPAGHWLRRTSVDELPQILNVLRGNMSIVGPRPVQPQELIECYQGHADVVFSVKPGLTGLWQVEGRSGVTYDERIAMDLEYIRRRSFLFDTLLLIRTVPAVLFMRGAA